jgi:hypothetical protein
VAQVENTLTGGGVFSRHRLKTGAPVAADAAPDGSFPNRRALLNCRGWDTIIGRVELTGGVGPTVDLEPLLYDQDTDSFAKHTLTGALATGDAFECLVVSGRVFLRINAVAGAPTAVEIRVTGGTRSRRPEE